MKKALGLIETIGLITAIEAADAAVKAANVVLLGYENTKGGGKITVKIVGDVGAVQAAVSAGTAAALRIGKVYGYCVIPRPHEEINALIRQVDRGQAQEQPDTSVTAPAPETPTAAEAGTPPVAESPMEKQCIAITKSGERCKLSARPDSEYCNLHRKLDPNAG